MKRKSNAEYREEVRISSDSEDEQQAETSEDDWEGNEDDEDEDDAAASDDEDDEDDADEDVDDADASDEEDDEDEDADEDEDDADASDHEDDDADEDEDYDDDNEEDILSISSDSEGVPYSKARKKASAGVHGNSDAETAKQGKRKTGHKQKLKKGSRKAIRGTISSGEDRKLFADALNIIRGRDLEKLSLEHCRAYLRHYKLRLTGSKTVLVDRVQEHIELKACGGMAKYPRSTFSINCTGDACTGDIVLFRQKVYENYNKACRRSTQPPLGKRVVAGRIVKESYGSDKQQHTFSVEVLWSRGPKPLPFLYPLLVKGRNLYRLQTFRQRWANEEERKRVLQEKHSRGSLARNAREDRISGKRHSRSKKRQHRDNRTKVTLKRENKSKVKRSQVDASPSKANVSRGKAWSENPIQETVFRERSMNSVVSSSHREHGSTHYERVRTTKCILDIKACFAGILIGAQGRHIGAIARASRAKLQIFDNPLNPTLRLVEIIGTPEQVQLATGMVVQSFLGKGLPPPVVTRQSSGFTGK